MIFFQLLISLSILFSFGLRAQWFQRYGEKAESRLGLHYAMNTQNQFHAHASLCHLIPVKGTPVLAGLGFSGHLFGTSAAEMLPSSRLLRSYDRPDVLYTKGFRTWNSSVFIAIKMHLYSILSLECRADIATVSAGKTLEMDYSTGIQQSAYPDKQEGKPTHSGFRNPLFRNIGSLGSQIWLVAGLTPRIELGVGYVRMRSEFTVSQLVNFSNDRFMLRSDMLGIRLAWRVFATKDHTPTPAAKVLD